jgi:TetR/AcrR family transcriptional regulator, mexJK operon transcriptional repressor
MTQAATLTRVEAPEGGKAGKILDAARRVFMTDGYGAASMDAIAKAAGVSKATVYAHFSGKDQLFGAIIAQQCRVHSAIPELDDIERSTPEEALRALGRNFADLVLSPEVLDLYRIVVAETARFPELGRTLYETGPKRGIGRLAEYLQQLSDRGFLDVPEPHIAARQFFGMIRSDLYLRRMFNISDAEVGITVEQMVDSSVRMFLRAYARGS